MSALIEAKKIQKVLDEYEKDLVETHLKEIVQVKTTGITVITAAKIQAVREIRDRLGIPEIKA
jgi:hypothetical protein